MSMPQVFMYVTEEQKELVSDVAHKLKTSESRLVKALALPQVHAIARALENGAKPSDVKKKISEKLEAVGM